MHFAPVGHLSANIAASMDFVEGAPWLYVIVALRDRLMYVGETSSLVNRLSDHFGPYRPTKSTLRRAAARVGFGSIRAPFVVVAARLPTDDAPPAPFDASSRKVRQLCEALVHAHLAKHTGRWWIVSTPQAPNLSATPDIEAACLSIATGCIAAIDFLRELASNSPVNLVLLGAQGAQRAQVEDEEALGALLARIELRLHHWLLDGLRQEYGERWWTEGVPVNSRVQCASRKEQEGASGIPAEAYLTFIDLRDIVQANWNLFGPRMETMTGARGKDRASRWLVELNEIRKLWAHPLKQVFLPISQDRRERVRELWNQMSGTLEGQS